jgi:FKBP-type peptidyl-prolyl cis-trans isomerase FkpA
MKNTTLVLLAFFSLGIIAGCSRGGGFKKTKSGIQYKIISDGKSPIAKRGEFLKVHYTQKVRDSILSTSANGMPTYAPVDSIGAVYSPAEIFPLLRKGDSAVIVMHADTLLRRQGQLPPFIKKKDKLTLTIRVVDVLPNQEALQKDQEQLLSGQKDKEIKAIQEYLTKNNIQAQKTEKGTFVEITQQGTGPAADSGKAVHVMYKGQTLSGRVFDTNLDSSFGHTDPYTFVIGTRSAIQGWDDGLRLFKKGGKGRLFIPSMLAYGQNPDPRSGIRPFENLMFDIEIVDVTDAPKQELMPR